MTTPMTNFTTRPNHTNINGVRYIRFISFVYQNTRRLKLFQRVSKQHTKEFSAEFTTSIYYKYVINVFDDKDYHFLQKRSDVYKKALLGC